MIGNAEKEKLNEAKRPFHPAKNVGKKYIDVIFREISKIGIFDNCRQNALLCGQLTWRHRKAAILILLNLDESIVPMELLDRVLSPLMRLWQSNVANYSY